MRIDAQEQYKFDIIELGTLKQIKINDY